MNFSNKEISQFFSTLEMVNTVSTKKLNYFKYIRLIDETHNPKLAMFIWQHALKPRQTQSSYFSLISTFTEVRLERQKVLS